MRLLKLFALLATLTVAPAAAAQADDGPPWGDDDDRPNFNLDVVLRPAAGGPGDGFGLVQFRQPDDPEKIVYLNVRLRRLAPNHSYYLQRATDADVNDDCTPATNWLKLGHGPVPAAINTDRKGNGRAALFRDLSAIRTGSQFDIHFRVIDAVSSAVVLESGCYQYTVRGPATAETLATFDPSRGEFPEGVAVDTRQHVYVGLALTGEIRRFDPQGGSATLATLPVGAGFLLGLATDARGNVYAALASFDPATHGVWRVEPDGSRKRITALPASGGPNALAFDKTGNLYVTDSALGAIWRIPRGGRPELFLRHPLLEPEPGTQIPGANGIALDRHSLLVTNTRFGRIVRIPIKPNGTAGEPTTLIEREDLIGADGVALDVRGNLYVVMFGGPAGGRLVRISPDGQVVQLAGEAEGLTGPASLAFGTTECTRTALFITNFDLFSTTPKPALALADVGIPGRPLPSSKTHDAARRSAGPENAAPRCVR